MPRPVITADLYLAFRERDLVRAGTGVPGAFNDALLRAENALNCRSVDCLPIEHAKYGRCWAFFDRDGGFPVGADTPERLTDRILERIARI